VNLRKFFVEFEPPQPVSPKALLSGATGTGLQGSRVALEGTKSQLPKCRASGVKGCNVNLSADRLFLKWRPNQAATSPIDSNRFRLHMSELFFLKHL
jgi:hypothetical protein